MPAAAISARCDPGSLATMPAYRAPLKEYHHLLDNLLRIDRYSHIERIANAGPELRGTVLAEAARFAENVLAPQSAVADREGCRLEEGGAALPESFRAAYRDLREAGWTGLALDPEFGGSGLPKVIADIVREMQISANMNLSGYLQLTESVYLAIRLHGTEEQKSFYLPRLASGEWTGAMHLTEAHAGTDLGLIRTRAKPAGDGSYRLNGTKTFISCAEHDLAENSVNLVLARIEGASAGLSGTSLFLVPRFLAGEDGKPGPRNAIRLVGLEHKLGLHASATGTIALEDATGYLVGRPGKGLKAMFTMVNETRLGVALQGLAIAQAAYGVTVEYAGQRLQGRAPDGPVRPDLPADPINVQPDVARTLLEMRAFIEGARAVVLWTSLQLDLARHSPDPGERRQAEMLAELLTPVLKAHLTDMGCRIADNAIQLHGGAGYIREQGVEQLFRDVRITRIYEGANAVIALDLAKRKLAPERRPAVETFLTLVDESVDGLDPDLLAPLREGLSAASADLRSAIEWCSILRDGAPRKLSAAASDLCELFGIVAVGWGLAGLAAISADALGDAGDDETFQKEKIESANFYAARILTRSGWLLQQVRMGEAAWRSQEHGRER